MIAEVIVDISANETDKIFEYLCDDNLPVGSRVLAPFGNRSLPGFVMKKKQTSSYPVEKLKKVIPTQDGLPALTKECLMLAEKLADRYRVPKALTLRLFLPSEMRTGKVRELYRNYAELVEQEDYPMKANAKNHWGVIEYLKEHGKTDCARCGGELIQRADDNEETVGKRLAVYTEQTQPLIDYYEKAGKLITVNGDQSIDEVFAEICEKLG